MFAAVGPRRVLAGAAGAVLIALGAVLPAAAPGPVRAAEPPRGAPPVGLEYGLYVGGLQALDFATRIDLAADRYEVRFRARTDGFVARLFPFVLEARSAGLRRDGRLRPSRYATANRWSDNAKRWVRLAYPNGPDGAQDGGEAAPEVAAEPPNGRDDRPVVPQAARTGTLDPISAIYGLVLQDPESCAGTRRIFDGRRRYDIVAEDAGSAAVEPSDYGLYDGPARLCRLKLQKVTGFWTKYDAKQRYPDTIDVWLAKVARDLPPLPVRLEAQTMLGGLRVHLTGIERGAAATLPESGLFPIEETRAGDGG